MTKIDLCIIGMPRSGTSFLCNILTNMGCDFFGNNKTLNDIYPLQLNPEGYFQRRDVHFICNNLKLFSTSYTKLNEKEINALGIEAQSAPCIVKTGEQDQVLHNSTCITVNNGHPILAKVIATGCALGALITALSSKTDCPMTASVAGLLWFGIAGEIVAEKSSGPGSFSPMFIDELYGIELGVLRDKAKLS